MKIKTTKPVEDDFILSPDECSLIIWYSFKFYLVFVTFSLILFVQDVFDEKFKSKNFDKTSDARAKSRVCVIEGNV